MQSIKTAALLLVCLMSVMLTGLKAEAAAAPPLTSVSAFMIGSEGTPLTFVPSAYPHNVDKTFVGENILLRLKYNGYPNWNAVFVKVNGQRVKWQELSRVPIQNPATGYFHNIAIPFSYFDKNKLNRLDISVQGNGRSCTTQVNGIRI